MMNAVKESSENTDVLFVVSVISDAMRRGVRHFKMDGTPLGRLNEVMEALASDGEILVDAAGSAEAPGH